MERIREVNQDAYAHTRDDFTQGSVPLDDFKHENVAFDFTQENAPYDDFTQFIHENVDFKHENVEFTQENTHQDVQ